MSYNIFRRGFLLSSLNPEEVSTKLASLSNTTCLTNYNKSYFGPYTLWYDEALRISTTRNNQYGLAILGFCIDPISNLNDSQDICDFLFNALTQSTDDFFKLVNNLSGTFTIIYRINSNAYLLNDAAGCKAVSFFHSQEGVTVSSSTHIISLLHNQMEDPDSKFILKNPSYQSDPSKYLPGTKTSHKNIYPLVANNVLDIQNGKLVRFYPTSPVAPAKNNNEASEEIKLIMEQQAKLISTLKRPIRIAATGGRDSRVSIAFFNQIPNTRLFSFYFSKTKHLLQDTEIAKRISECLDLEIDIYDLDKHWDLNFQPHFDLHSPLGIWPSAAHCYLSKFSNDTIHIRSTVSEIGRVFYKSRTYPTTPKSLASCYTNSEYRTNSELISEMAKYMKFSNFNPRSFYNIDPYDLYYWEHRNSKWQNILCMEAELASDVFIPFNNRKIIEHLLSVPIEDRVSATIHRQLWLKKSPELDSIELA